MIQGPPRNFTLRFHEKEEDGRACSSLHHLLHETCPKLNFPYVHSETWLSYNGSHQIRDKWRLATEFWRALANRTRRLICVERNDDDQNALRSNLLIYATFRVFSYSTIHGEFGLIIPLRIVFRSNSIDVSFSDTWWKDQEDFAEMSELVHGSWRGVELRFSYQGTRSRFINKVL